MEEVKSVLSNALDTYFTTLSKTGYQNSTIVNSLVALSAIDFVLDNFQQYLESDDIRAIQQALNCLGDQCIIGMTGNGKSLSLFHSNLLALKLRITEGQIGESNNMNTETGIHRLPE